MNSLAVFGLSTVLLVACVAGEQSFHRDKRSANLLGYWIPFGSCFCNPGGMFQMNFPVSNQLYSELTTHAQARAEAQAYAHNYAQDRAKAHAQAYITAPTNALAQNHAQEHAESLNALQGQAYRRAYARIQGLFSNPAQDHAYARAFALAEAQAEMQVYDRTYVETLAEAGANAEAKVKAEAEVRTEAEAKARDQAQAHAQAIDQAVAKARAEAQTLCNTSVNTTAKTNAKSGAAIIDGKMIAKEIEKEVSASVESWVKSGKRRPKLMTIIVGDDPASKVYVSKKLEVAKAVGIDAKTLKFDKNISQELLLDTIESLNNDSSVDGILVQLPLPQLINERKICEAVTPSKDVDGFHSENMGKLSVDSNSIVPATALGVKELIVRSKVDTFGKNAVVIGRSKHVGLPIALLLHSDKKGETGALDMTTTICHRYTPPEELKKFVRMADVVVAAAGVPGLVTKDMVKPGACIIDVGITRVKTDKGHKLMGDVDFENVKEIAGYITPVPGGVGPMTVVMLMKNTLKAAQMNSS